MLKNLWKIKVQWYHNFEYKRAIKNDVYEKVFVMSLNLLYIFLRLYLFYF